MPNDATDREPDALIVVARSVLPVGAALISGPVQDQLHHSFHCRLATGELAWLKLDREQFVGAGVRREAECLEELARFEVERIPRLLSAGTAADGTPYLLTSHLAGTRLDHLLATTRAVQWQTVADWLARFHRLGDQRRVHGSFDTRNILIAENGVLAGVIDFEAHRFGPVEADVASLFVDVVEWSTCAGNRLDGVRNATRLLQASMACLPLVRPTTARLALQRIARRLAAGAISPPLAGDLRAVVEAALGSGETLGA